jgi:GTP-binding protein HflX
MQLDVEVLIFDRNLTPAQGAAIAQVTDLKVLDRTQLILDIFAQRAESRDGKLQVELAQMRYLLPRLGQKDDSLSRLTGGIGGRGPGETKLEIGRRRARERITYLEHQLKQTARQRKERRRKRARHDVPIVAIVGYTNAGKSTLLNTLTESSVLSEDKLFATLDTRSRRLKFPREQEVVITDTVGFIRDLPKELFSAFRATFEEAQDADLLLHVIDSADPNIAEHIATTEKLLEELELDQVPRLVVYNKADRLPPDEANAKAREHDGVAVSALDKNTLRPLLERMEHMLFVARGHSTSLLGTPVTTGAPEDAQQPDANDFEEEHVGQEDYEGFGAHAEE